MFSCFPVVDWARHIWNALLCPLLFVGMERSIKCYWQVKRRAQDKEHSPAAQESKAQESATSGALGGGQVVVVGVPALQPATIVDCLLLQPQLRIQKLMCTVPTALPQRDRGEGSPQLSLPTLDHFCPPLPHCQNVIYIHIHTHLYLCLYLHLYLFLYPYLYLYSGYRYNGKQKERAKSIRSAMRVTPRKMLPFRQVI